MTNGGAGWIRTSAVAAIFAGLDPAPAQNLTFFREYNVPPPSIGSSGFASDGKATVYVLIGDALRK
jgi:hypothetical protein